jgi:DNA polymerase III alpha subunit
MWANFTASARRRSAIIARSSTRPASVDVRPLDINASDWDCTLEPDRRSADAHALRLGLRLASGLSEKEARQIVTLRHAGNGAPGSQ